MNRIIFMLVAVMAFSGAARADAIDDAKLCALKDENSKVRLDVAAFNACTAAIKSGDLAPDYLANVYYDRGSKYAIKDSYDRAIVDFSQALKLKPFLIKALLKRGVAYLKRGDKHSAGADFSQAIRLEPDDERGFVFRGGLLLNDGQTDLAIADFSVALRINPSMSVIFATRGNAYLRKGELDRAVADFSDAIRLDPVSTFALLNRIETYLRLGAFDLALADSQKVIRLEPNLTLGYIARATAYLQKAAFDLSIADWNHVILMTPENPELYINKAKALNAYAWSLATSGNADERDGREAVRLSLEALQLYKSYEIRDTLAAAYAEDGRFDDAVTEQERAIVMMRDAGQQEMIASAQSRLDLYRSGQPYRQ